MRLLAFPELKTVKGVDYSRPHLFRLIKAGEFPQPLKMGRNRNGWVESEVDAWIRAKIDERDSGRAPKGGWGLRSSLNHGSTLLKEH